MTLATVNMLWIGPRLGEIHAACIRSFLRIGHRVVLHIYEEPVDAPKGVGYFDAQKLMDQSSIVRHRKHGSLALASDIYRYRIIRAGLGLYADCDMYCVAPIVDSPYIFGWGSRDHITSAILKFPPGSAIVEDLCAAADDLAFIPPWDPAPKRLFHRFMKGIGRPVTVDRQRWGTIGPRAVTWYVHKNGLQNQAAAIEVFSPVRSKEQARLYDPSLTIESLTSEKTLAIHLRNELIRRRGQAEIPKTSPLGRMIAT